MDKDFLAPDRPTSFDEAGHHLKVYPAKVKGFFRRWRNAVYTFLIGLFLVVPWTTFDGHQTILLDLPNRRFQFFNLTLFAHDAPLIFFVLALAAFSIIFATSVWGRVWCGWACPQTVFIDSIFRRIEELIEGNHLKRRQLDQQDWNLTKLSKKSLKWFLFFIASAHISHSFFAYFVGAKNLVWITLASPTEHWGLFVMVQVFTLILLLDFGWFREQFCLIACPYGRFQSVLMDANSLAPLYDPNRGEPRKQKGLKDFGDCINCMKCVQVCPTGIDIRDGLQLECIACTACIDVCDEVMEKIKKPKGLIRYASENEIEGRRRKTLSTRNYIYIGLLIVFLSGLVYNLALRDPLDIEVIRAAEAPYSEVTGSDGTQYLNHFRIHVTNQSLDPVRFTELTIHPKPLQIISPELSQVIAPGEERFINFFVKFSHESTDKHGRASARWVLKSKSTADSGQITLLAPGK